MAQVQLIHSPDDYVTDMREARWYPPLNLVAIGTYLERNGVTCELLDGQILTVEEIISKISSPLIGISFTCISSHNLDKICEAGREKGAEIIVGGQAATPLARALLSNNKNIDGVVLYEGEEAMLSLSRHIDYDKISNLAFRRTDGQVFVPISSEVKHFHLRDAPIPDRMLKGVNFRKHLEFYRKDKRFLPIPYKAITNAYTHRGCLKRARGKGCSFCSRVDIATSCYSPEKAWREYQYLADLGVDCVGDYSDDYIFANWLKEYASYCDNHGLPNTALRIYACVESMTKENVELLKKIGVRTVLLGIESGDKEVLAKNGKYYSADDVIIAAERLGKAGILLSDAYVFGMIGESEGSLKKTIAMSEAIRQVCETEISYWNICTPLPGSGVWKLLMQFPDMKKEFEGEYHLDTSRLEKEFLKRFTSVSYEYLQEIKMVQAKKSKIFSTEFTAQQKIIDK